jgi:error-prone DNA polymerase
VAQKMDKIDEQIDNYRILSEKFQRTLPNTSEYTDRLAEEIELITEQKFVPHFLRVLEVLELTKDIPHITRGSAGSSLVCWLLGITDVDPVEHSIPLARFINPLRDDLPDIDIDFPYNKHKEVLDRIYKHWPGRAARLSNYVKYREKSAKKEAAKRVAGIKGAALKDKDPDELIPKENYKEYKSLQARLIGKKRCISKHPGGVVVFDQPPAKSLIREDNQILLDKYEVEDLALLKIDVLSNRGLAQLLDCRGLHPMQYPNEDNATVENLATGKTLGVVQGESPVMRRTLMSIKPTCKEDLIIATALIRPAAVTGRTKGTFFRDFIGHNKMPSKLQYKDGLIFDEDAIDLIVKELGCDTFHADMYRRGFVKKNEEMMWDFFSRIGDHPYKADILYLLSNMDGFGLCKAHAINLANLVWALTMEKTHDPKTFWLSALQHNCSMYRPWVHIEQAKRSGWRIEGWKRPWLIDGNTLYNDGWRVPLFDNHCDQVSKMGFWTHDDFMPGCYYTEFGNIASFCGLIAAHRCYNKGNKQYVTFVSLGCNSGDLIDIVLPGLIPCGKYAVIEGHGTVEFRNGIKNINVTKFSARDIYQHSKSII